MQKFSFLSKVVKYQRGQEVEIHTSRPLTVDAIVQLRSSFKDLDNKIYPIKANSTLIFKYIPKSDGFVEAVRVWNVVWEDDGIFDFRFEMSRPTVEVPAISVSSGYSDSLDTIKPTYMYKGWTNIEIFKTVSEENQIFEFWLSEHNNAQYTITSSDVDFVVKNPDQFFTVNKDYSIEISETDLTELIICLKIYFGSNEYNLQGCNTLEDLEKELLFFFGTDSKINIYRNQNKITILSSYDDRLKFRMIGANEKTINKFFTQKSLNKNVVIIQCVNKNWKKKTVEFKIVANDLVKRPTMKIHFKTLSNENYIFELEKDLVVGESNVLYLMTTDFNNEHLLQVSNNITCENLFGTKYIEEESDDGNFYWNITANYGEEAVFKIGDLCEQTFKVFPKTENIKLFYNVNISKEEVVLKLYLSKVLDKDYNYSIKFIDRISKQDIDFKLSSNYQTINAGQLEKKERIVWNNSNIIRSFDIVINDEIVPVVYFDKNSYCSSIGLKNKESHYLNRGVNRDLTLEYIDGIKVGKIYLKANQNSWTYIASNNSVNWKVYDQEILIFEQTVDYVIDQKPSLKIYLDETINSRGVSYLTLKTDWPIKSFIDFEIVTTSNTNIALSGKYRFSPDQTEMKFKLTPLKLRTNPGYLTVQILSASIEFDNKRYNCIIN